MSLIQSIDISSNSISSVENEKEIYISTFLDINKWNMKSSINLGTDFLVSLIVSNLDTTESNLFNDLSTIISEFSTEIFSDCLNLLGINPAGNFCLIMIGTISLDRERYHEELKKEIPLNRLIIQDIISKNPGISLREIQRMTNFGMGGIQYHIYQLELNIIESFKFGRCKHFFISSASFSAQEKILYSLKRNSNINDILEAIYLAQNGCSQKDLTNYTGNSKSLISYYVKILRNHGIIEETNRILKLSDLYSQILNFYH
ncbi:MAG: winged helix-turn-helix transcriptional regulator [Candidatus Hodarchaeota archaeon]